MKKLSSKKKIRQIKMLNKNLQKMKLRKSKRVKDDKKAAEKERMLPRNRQVQNYYIKKPRKIIKLKMMKKLNKEIKKQYLDLFKAL